MRNTSFIITLLFIGFFIFSCSSEKKEKPAGTIAVSTPTFNAQWAKSYIDSLNAQFSAQFSTTDSDALAKHYWPDAQILLSNMDPIKGEKIVSAWGAVTRAGIKDFNFYTNDIIGDAELMIETGVYEMKNVKGGMIDQGKYIAVWQLRKDEWKLYRFIANTSLRGFRR
ncbi:MAG TPA: DUF4440 domain-containing protein [Puia sp.]|nr:DUF4440 domain-containing protein [Puia sp.]